MFTTKVVAAVAITAAALLPGAAVWAAGNANATPYDDLYLHVLHQQGIASHNGDAALVALGHAVCTARLNGDDDMTVMNIVSANNPELSDYDSGFVVGAAEGAYCPSMINRGMPA